MRISIVVVIILCSLVEQSICKKSSKFNWSNFKFGTKYREPIISQSRQIYNINRQGRVNGGSFVSEDEEFLYKHQVRLSSRTELRPLSRILCGGSLIAEQYVVTAAHCLDDYYFETRTPYKADRTACYFGILNLDDIYLDSTVSRYSIEYKIHPHWNPRNPDTIYDIALIKLDSPVLPNDKIGVISLPAPGLCEDFENESVVVSGWGRVTDYQIKPENHLKAVKINIGNSKKCKKFWGNQFDRRNMLCAIGPNNEGTCEGDSGGPMTHRNLNDELELIGITSFGGSTCENIAPRVFTCISAYLNWIQKSIAD